MTLQLHLVICRDIFDGQNGRGCRRTIVHVNQGQMSSRGWSELKTERQTTKLDHQWRLSRPNSMKKGQVRDGELDIGQRLFLPREYSFSSIGVPTANSSRNFA